MNNTRKFYTPFAASRFLICTLGLLSREILALRYVTVGVGCHCVSVSILYAEAPSYIFQTRSMIFYLNLQSQFGTAQLSYRFAAFVPEAYAVSTCTKVYCGWPQLDGEPLCSGVVWQEKSCRSKLSRC